MRKQLCEDYILQFIVRGFLEGRTKKHDDDDMVMMREICVHIKKINNNYNHNYINDQTAYSIYENVMKRVIFSLSSVLTHTQLTARIIRKPEPEETHS